MAKIALQWHIEQLRGSALNLVQLKVAKITLQWHIGNFRGAALSFSLIKRGRFFSSHQNISGQAA